VGYGFTSCEKIRPLTDVAFRVRVDYSGPNKIPEKKMKKLPKPPSHLKTATRRWWKMVLENFDLEESELPLLEAACVSWDRACEARRLIDEQGLTVSDRFGQLKANPACGIERDSLATYGRLIRQLGFGTSETESYELVRPTRK
jgi:P27 family predicted phage terminase small subunit